MAPSRPGPDAAGYLRSLWAKRLAIPNPQARTILAERDGEVLGLAHAVLGHDATWAHFPATFM